VLFPVVHFAPFVPFEGFFCLSGPNDLRDLGGFSVSHPRLFRTYHSRCPTSVCAFVPVCVCVCVCVYFSILVNDVYVRFRVSRISRFSKYAVCIRASVRVCSEACFPLLSVPRS